MQYLGVVRNIDQLGRLVIPSNFRKRFNLNKYEAVEIIPQEGGVFIRQYSITCSLCGGTENLMDFELGLVCPSCVKKMKAL